MRSMKMCFVTVFGLAVLTCSIVLAERAVYEANYFEGVLPLTMDGDLSDWDNLGAVREELTHWASERRLPKPAPEDLSGWFMCVADDHNLYIAVHVTDDVLVTGVYGFSRSHFDDVIEICFDGDLKNQGENLFDANDGQIMIVGGREGVRWLSGAIPFLGIVMPHYWEKARGVEAGYRQFPGGCAAELKIPLNVLGINKVSAGIQIGLNVRVLEIDVFSFMPSGLNVKMIESDNMSARPGFCPQQPRNKGVLTWSYDPEFTSSWSTLSYNLISFSPGNDIPAGKRPESVFVSGSPYMDEINRKLSEYDFKGAIEAYENVEEELWAKCMISAISLFDMDYKTGIKLLEECLTSGDEAVSTWARNFPREYAMLVCTERFSSRYAALNPLFPEIPYKEIAVFLNEWLRINHDPDTSSYLFNVVSQIRMKMKDEYIGFLGSLSNSAANKDVADNIKVRLAWAYLEQQMFTEAQELLIELFNSDLNPELRKRVEAGLISIYIMTP